MKKILSLIAIPLLLFNCDTTNIQNSDEIIISKLNKEWTHSFEEETDSVQVYRPSEFKNFPVSRFRQIYSFKESGSCSYLVLASNDAHYFNQGSWHYSAEIKTLSIIDSSNQIVKKYKLIEVSKEALKLVQLH